MAINAHSRMYIIPPSCRDFSRNMGAIARGLEASRPACQVGGMGLEVIPDPPGTGEILSSNELKGQR